MPDDLISYSDANAPVISAWQPISFAAAMPYLKALGLATTLIGMWAGLCAI
jgi:hypothetical protein